MTLPKFIITMQGYFRLGQVNEPCFHPCTSSLLLISSIDSPDWILRFHLGCELWILAESLYMGTYLLCAMRFWCADNNRTILVL